jgi:signal transduction histidine kinase
MFDYSWRILTLSLIISFSTAVLVYLSLHWLFVRPMIGLTESMVAFRRDPENVASTIEPGARSDEVGRARRELSDMQAELRKALQQREHLAALGSALTKISHDLRNILATAQVVSDGLASSKDPSVTRAAPRLFAAIDRAVKLCSETLRFAHEGTPPPQRAPFDLATLYRDVADTLSEPNQGRVSFHSRIEEPFEVTADRDQIYRVLLNVLMNAAEAGADQITATATRDHGAVTVEIADNGPGLPPKVRQNLFQAFSGGGRAGGTGLGLAIARDLMRAHGGDIELARSSDTGTVFRLRLPEPENVFAPDRLERQDA